MTPPRLPSSTSLPHLSGGELEVMKVLWGADRLSAREVHERLGDGRGWAPSTSRTLIDRLVKKGAVVREDFHGLHLYRAAVGRAEGLARMVRDFAREVLEAPPLAVVPLMAQVGNLSESELAELEALLGRDDTEES